MSRNKFVTVGVDRTQRRIVVHAAYDLGFDEEPNAEELEAQERMTKRLRRGLEKSKEAPTT